MSISYRKLDINLSADKETVLVAYYREGDR